MQESNKMLVIVTTGYFSGDDVTELDFYNPPFNIYSICEYRSELLKRYDMNDGVVSNDMQKFINSETNTFTIYYKNCESPYPVCRNIFVCDADAYKQTLKNRYDDMIASVDYYSTNTSI